MAEKEDPIPNSSGRANLIERLLTGTAETTVRESATHSDSLQSPWNQDDLYKKDAEYGIYEDMRKDDQVSIAMAMKKDLVLSSGWDIICENEEHEEIRQDIEVSFREDLKVPLEDQLAEILTAYDFGFSLTEKIFRKRDNGTATLKELKTRHPATWLIFTDKHGNIERFEQQGADNTKDINPLSLIHYVNNREFQNPYGTSDLRAAYSAWFIKRQIIRFYAIYLEKAASPIPIARYEKGTTKKMVDTIFGIIKKFQTKTAMTLPKEVELEFLEAKTNGEAYIKGINIFNMFIGRSLFIPDLLGFQGAETSGGSFSLGKEQMNVFFKHIRRRRLTLEHIINREIIKPLVFFNHGFIDCFPKFKFRPLREEDALEGAKLWIEAVKTRIYKPTGEEINHFRSIVNFPESDIEDMEIEKELDPVIDPKIENNKDDKEEFAKPFKTSEIPFDFKNRVDFKSIENQMENTKNAILDESKPILSAFFTDLIKQIQKKKIIEKQDISKVETLNFNKMNKIKNILDKNLNQTFKDSKTRAAKEIDKSNFASPIIDEKFLEILENENFSAVGKWKFSVEEGTRTSLIKAIKDGKPLTSLVKDFDDLEKAAQVSIERYARTKTTEVLNKGRMAFFEDSGVVNKMQYSAIMDDRTTVICSGLHGKVFDIGNAPVPPNHWNCRSILIPITIFEPVKIDKQSNSGQQIDGFIDKNLGKGFSRR